jgi:hypothetical protein
MTFNARDVDLLPDFFPVARLRKFARPFLSCVGTKRPKNMLDQYYKGAQICAPFHPFSCALNGSGQGGKWPFCLHRFLKGAQICTAFSSR